MEEKLLFMKLKDAVGKWLIIKIISKIDSFNPCFKQKTKTWWETRADDLMPRICKKEPCPAQLHHVQHNSFVRDTTPSGYYGSIRSTSCEDWVMDPPMGSGSGEAGSEHSCNLDKPRPRSVCFPSTAEPDEGGDGACILVGLRGVCSRQGLELPLHGRSPLNSNTQVKCGYFLSIECLGCFIWFSLLVLIWNEFKGVFCAIGHELVWWS